jgi:hypothetical protein
LSSRSRHCQIFLIPDPKRDIVAPYSVRRFGVREELMAERVAIRKSRFQLECVVAICLCSLLMICPILRAAQLSKTERHLQRAVTELVKKSDADSLAAAGLLNLSINRGDSLALIARATSATPDRPDLVWLEAQVCPAVAGCDPEPIERRLRELDPSNGAGWLGALNRADSSKYDKSKDAALTAIGNSDHVDVYYTTLVARLSRAAAETKAISLEEAVTSIIGVLAAQAIPAYGAASRACKGEQLQRAEIIDVCRRVARAFERGDTYLTEMIGVAIAKRVWPEDSPQWKEAAEARRVYEYRSKLALEGWATSHLDEYLTLCAQNGREQDVFLAGVIAAGKDPSPPPE